MDPNCWSQPADRQSPSSRRSWHHRIRSVPKITLEVVEIDGVVFDEVAATAIKAQPAIEVDEPVCVGPAGEVAKPRAGTAKDRPVISNIAE